MRTPTTAVLALCAAAHAGPPCTLGWRPDPIGLPGTSAVVRAMTVYDDGGGQALYVAGPFFTAGGITVNSIAKWNGSAWSALGTGMVGPIPTSAAAVNGLGTHNDGTGMALYAAGNLLIAGGVPANRIAKWNGTAWSALGPGVNQGAQAIASFDDGGGAKLYVGGSFTMAGTTPGTIGIARWDGSAWTSVGGGMASGSCNTLVVHNDGTGAALYAGGTFTMAGGVPGTSCIARWSGTAWSALGTGMSGGALPRVNSIAFFDDGAGVVLHAGGLFDTAGGSPAANLARWSGAAWAEVGGGTSDNVIRMAVFDDGSIGGPSLYIGGSFFAVYNAAPISVNQVASYRDGEWSQLDGGLASASITTASAMAVFDDGSGESLYIGGGFNAAGGQAVSNIVRWGCDATCYANCDGSTTPPVLNVADFGCFLNRFAAGDSYANCDHSTSPPVLNVQDFGCFLNAFAEGCG